jgi:hypothetical protein
VTSESHQTCNEKNDAYYPVCSRLTKLCPRLVPSPLWGLSLASIARMAPQAALAVCDNCDEIVESVYRYWMSLDRTGRCGVCGKEGNEIDEDWRYCVLVKGEPVQLTEEVTRVLEENPEAEGVAYLKGLRLLCKKCHLAKHLGYAMVTGRLKEAVEHLATVNSIGLNELKKYTKAAFRTHSLLSQINKWTIRIGEIEGLNTKLATLVESFLNDMYSRGFFLYHGWLYYQNTNDEELIKRAVRETEELVMDVTNELNSLDINLIINKLVNVLRSKLEEVSIEILESEVRAFLTYTVKEPIHATLSKRRTLKASVKSLILEIGHLVENGTLTGKWMVFVPTSLYPKVFRAIINSLERAGIAYHGKIIAKREDYKRRDDMPVIIYVPSGLSLGLIIETAYIMRRVLNEFHVYKKMYFKPDIFTQKGIYSGTSRYKSYIYVF